MSSSAGTDIAVGFVVAFLVAYGVVKTFIAFVGRYELKPFGWYRIATGLLLSVYLLTR
jgi:undecaprenyl-diphosphatase